LQCKIIVDYSVRTGFFDSFLILVHSLFRSLSVKVSLKNRQLLWFSNFNILSAVLYVLISTLSLSLTFFFFLPSLYLLQILIHHFIGETQMATQWWIDFHTNTHSKKIPFLWSFFLKVYFVLSIFFLYRKYAYP
jgi:hypothetical protein